jgi:hypothetical protein
MPQLEIVCATWNTANKSPNNQQIMKFYDALWRKRNQKAPDFVVIGLQEAVPHNNEFLTQFCLRTAGPDMKRIMVNGKSFEGTQFWGMTKAVQCYQHIGIMQRTDSPWRVVGITGHKKDKPGIAGTLSEKGALALTVDVEVPAAQGGTRAPFIRLCFLSTHLDSYKGQEEELNAHIKWLDKDVVGTTVVPTSDIRFIMGDLNFRLIPPETKVAGLPDDKDDAKAWAAALLDPGKREQLLQHYDGFERKWLRHNDGWDAPKPKTNYGTGKEVSWPSYLRYMPGKDELDDKAAGYIKTITEAPSTPQAIDATKRLYLEHSDGKGGFKPLWNKDRKAWDIGWLDRIMYLIGDASTAMTVDEHLAPTSADPRPERVNVPAEVEIDVVIDENKVEKVECWDCFDMVMSDHTPVFMYLKADVTVA